MVLECYNSQKGCSEHFFCCDFMDKMAKMLYNERALKGVCMIKLKNVSYKVFDKQTGKEKYIIKDLTLDFPENKVTIITGHNGSGKSTLVKLIMGVIKPTSGEILFGDKMINDLSIDERAKLGITIAFQQPVKFKGLTVRDLLNLASKTQNKIPDACEYLAKVGLCAKDYIDRELDDKLSGGELKRIELAIALAKGGKIMLFDEPEAGIDLWSFDSLVSIFKQLKGKTVIIVSHQKKLIDNADYVLRVDSTKDTVLGKKKDMLPLLNSPKCRKLGGMLNG